MIRAVIDTNVFVSSFFGGVARQVVDAWKEQRFTLCLSNPIVEEYIAVLQRLGVASEFELSALLQLFAEGRNILYAANTPTLRILEKDPDDDKFLECAVALRGQFIVSGDRHLTTIKKYMTIEILPPRKFLNTLAAL